MKFFLRILIVLGMLGAASLHAQQPQWLWAQSGGGLKQDQSNSIAVDSIGEVFVTGSFQDSALFSGTDIRASQGDHFFLAKYSANGTLLWIQTSSLPGHSVGMAVCISQNKYLYLIGYFSDSLNLGKNILTSPLSTNNFFLAKYDLDGVVQWAISATASGADLRKSVVSDRSGNAYVCGSYSASTSFDTVLLHQAGKSGIYMAKFAPNGSALWAKGFGSGSTSNAGIGITLDRSENIILTGSFGDTVDFGGIRRLTFSTSDIFIAKYTSNGNLLWTGQLGAQDMGEGVSVTTDTSLNVYVTGSFSGTASSLSCDGVGNILIAKYSSNGIPQWMKCAGAGGEESGNSIAIDSTGFLYVTGGTDFAVNFGTGTLPNNGLIDAFIVKLNSSGVAQWADHAGAAGTDMGTAVTVDSKGDPYLTGIFSDNCFFGPFLLSSRNLTDVFVAKIGQPLDVRELHSASGAISFFPNPGKNQVTAEFISSQKDVPFEIELFSLLGVSVKKIITPPSAGDKQSISIPFGDLPRGSYFCRITSAGNMYSGVIVVGE